MSEIRIDIRNKIAVNPEPQRQVVVCGNSDYSIRFSFDAEWNAYNTKTARFAYNGQYQDVVFTGAVCSVPVMQGVHGFTVGVYAGNLHTTTPATVYAKKSVLCEAGSPADPVTSVYNQIMEEVGRKANSNHTHSYNDLTNKPDIPEAYDDTEVKQMIQGKAAANHTHSYNSLTDKPTIPTVDSNSINAALGIDVVQAIENAERQIDGLDEGKADADHVHSYNELQDKPVIPAAYDDTALAERVTVIEGKEAGWNAKQEAIADIDTIRRGADAGATAVKALQVDGQDLTSDDDGKVNIPRMGANISGVAKVNEIYGLELTSDGFIRCSRATDSAISQRTYQHRPITVGNLNYAVKSALTDSNRITGLTDAEKANACDVIGAVKQKTASKTTYTLTESQNYIEISIPEGISFIDIIGRNSASANGFVITYALTIDGVEKTVIAMINGTSTGNGYFNACFENKFGYLFGYGVSNFGNATAARKNMEITAALTGIYPWHISKLKIYVSSGSSYEGTTFNVLMA